MKTSDSPSPQRTAFLSQGGGTSVLARAWVILFALWVTRENLPGEEPSGSPQQGQEAIDAEVTQGALRVQVDHGKIVECPLKRTEVQASIAGSLARVRVTQTFHNPFAEKIEAVYVFPLPHNAAVDDMTMIIGSRRIVGEIRRRAEARHIYEQALASGITASLLEQERPNIFTQSVGNIEPGQQVEIQIAYVNELKYDLGSYEFHFPMVVGPRYIPGAAISTQAEAPDSLRGKVGEVGEIHQGKGNQPPSGTGWSPDTDRVPDASRITPPVLKPGWRNGHDISLRVDLDAGVPIQALRVPSHRVQVARGGPARAILALSPEDSIPNKDFILRYDLAGEKPELAALSHSDPSSGGTFMLMIQPKIEKGSQEAPARELFFLIDVSGSMHGGPSQEVRQAMTEFLNLVRLSDTIQVITFASHAQDLFEKPVAATPEHLARARSYSERLEGGGGTEMLLGVRKTLNSPLDPGRVRIVILLTDGFIGNEKEIFEEVGRRCGAHIRFFAIGIGSSPNRFLLDGVANQGGGMSATLRMDEDPRPLVQQIMFRIQMPQMTSIRVDWGGLEVADTYPVKIPDLWANQPVVIFGRYLEPGEGVVTLEGQCEGLPVSHSVTVHFPEDEPEHDVLPQIWARKKIAELSEGIFLEKVPEMVEEVTQLALEHRLMSAYTSFVAVDETERKKAPKAPRRPRRMPVPVPLPEGVSFEGIFGPAPKLEELRLIGAYSGESRAPTRAEDRGSRPGRTAVSGSLQSVAIAEEDPLATWVEATKELDSGYARKAYELFKQLTWDYPESKWAKYARGKLTAPVFDRINESESGGQSLGKDARKPWELLGLSADSSQKLLGVSSLAVAAAVEYMTQGDFASAQARFQHAWLLALAAEAAGVSDQRKPRHDSSPLRFADLEEQLLQARIRQFPALGRRLEIFLRNCTLQEAMSQVLHGIPMTLTFVPGSEEDVKKMLSREELDITFLDLRDTTIAQALTCLLTPFHLTWEVSPAGDTMTVGTARRLERTSAWVYSLRGILLPVPGELGSDESRHSEIAYQGVKESARDLLHTLRLALPSKDESGFEPGSATLLDVDRLLVYGDATAHGRVESVLDALMDSEADLSPILGRPLKPEEEERWKRLKRIVPARLARFNRDKKSPGSSSSPPRKILELEPFTWKLPAAALAGQKDLEALSYYQAVWRDLGRTDTIHPAISLVLTRSAYLILESTAALPDDPELQAMARKAADFILSTGKSEMEELEGNPQPACASLSRLYAFLAARVAGRLETETVSSKESRGMDEVRDRLVQGHVGPLATAAQIFAMDLIQEGTRKPLEKAFVESLGKEYFTPGEDTFVIKALVARRLGRNVWDAFRRARAELVACHRPSGPAILFVDRLSTRKPYIAR